MTGESVTYALISHLGTIRSSSSSGGHTSYAVDKTLQLAGWQFDRTRSPHRQPGHRAAGRQGAARGRGRGAIERQRKAGLLVGDRIKGVDGQAITEWAQFVERVQQSPEQPLQVTVERAGSDLTPDPDPG